MRDKINDQGRRLSSFGFPARPRYNSPPMDAIGGAQGMSLIGRRPLGSLLVLLILIALGYWLRVHNLDAFSFWTDEGLTPERSGYPVATILRNDIVIQGIVTKDTSNSKFGMIGC